MPWGRSVLAEQVEQKRGHCGRSKINEVGGGGEISEDKCHWENFGWDFLLREMKSHQSSALKKNGTVIHK